LSGVVIQVLAQLLQSKFDTVGGDLYHGAVLRYAHATKQHLTINLVCFVW
jgi:hypothetical protein